MNRVHEYFSLQRLWLCIKRDMKPNSRSSFIVLGAAVGFLLIISALDVVVGDAAPDFHEGIFYPILIAGGFIFTSGIFRELHRKETNLTYLMLPASALEKVVSRLLLASAGWIVFTLLWYTAYSALSEGLNLLFFGRSHPVFNPFTGDVWTAAAHYAVLQSIFLLGAVFFRKLHFFKTLLALTTFAIGLALFAGLIARAVFADYFSATMFVDGGEGISLMTEQLSWKLHSLGRSLEPAGRVIYWLVFPLFSWTLVYIRFREVQIKDGV